MKLLALAASSGAVTIGAGRARSSVYAFRASARHSVASGSLKPRSVRLAAASAPIPE